MVGEKVESIRRKRNEGGGEGGREEIEGEEIGRG